MELFKQARSRFWSVSFIVDGRRIRKSTGQTTKAKAMEVGAELIRQVRIGDSRPMRPASGILLRDFASGQFLPFSQNSSLDSDTKRYYATGWRLLSTTPIADQKLHHITTSDADTLQFPGSGSNANCALRTLRRMLSYAVEKHHIKVAPRIKLRKEYGRSATFDAAMEQAFMQAAGQPVKDVFLISQDSGMRPDEVIRMRWENVLWDKSLIFVPDGKTAKARRYVPMSDRVRSVLRVRSQGKEGEWVFPSSRKKGSHISYFPVAKGFSKARKAAGIPDRVVLYTARHSFATDLLDQTGNLALVQAVMGHESVTTTARYLHPSLRGIAGIVNERNRSRVHEYGKENCHTLCHTRPLEEAEVAVSR